MTERPHEYGLLVLHAMVIALLSDGFSVDNIAETTAKAIVDWTQAQAAKNN